MEVIELKKKTKFGEFDKRKRRKKKPDLLSVEKLLDKDNTLSGMTKSDDYIPNITQKPNESAVSFVRRLNIMTQVSFIFYTYFQVNLLSLFVSYNLNVTVDFKFPSSFQNHTACSLSHFKCELVH